MSDDFTSGESRPRKKKKKKKKKNQELQPHHRQTY